MNKYMYKTRIATSECQGHAHMACIAFSTWQYSHVPVVTFVHIAFSVVCMNYDISLTPWVWCQVVSCPVVNRKVAVISPPCRTCFILGYMLECVMTRPFVKDHLRSRSSPLWSRPLTISLQSYLHVLIPYIGNVAKLHVGM